jgi:hypothetical protein
VLIWGCDECSISIDTHAIAQRVFKIDSHLLFLRGGCAKAQFLSKDFVFCAAFHWPVLKAAAATLTVRETQSFFFASAADSDTTQEHLKTQPRGEPLSPAQPSLSTQFILPPLVTRLFGQSFYQFFHQSFHPHLRRRFRPTIVIMLRSPAAQASIRCLSKQNVVTKPRFFQSSAAPAALSPYNRQSSADVSKNLSALRKQSTAAATA